MKKMMRKFENLYLMLGMIFAVLSFKVFLIPSGINIGGFAGISQLLKKVWGIPFFVSTIALNGLLYAWGTKRKGWKFVVRSIVTTLIFSLLLDYPINVRVQIPLWVTAVFASIGAGLGFGLILSGDSSTGGSDLLGAIISAYFPKVSIGTAMILTNLSIIVVTGATTGLIYGGELFIVSIVTTIISNIIIDLVYCRNTGKELPPLIQNIILLLNSIILRIKNRKPSVPLFHSKLDKAIPTLGDIITVEVNGTKITFLVTDIK